MIDHAVTFLNSTLNGHLTGRVGSAAAQSTVSKLFDDNGRYAVADDSLATSIINVEEERVMRAQTPDYTLRAGRHVVTQPPLRLNLMVMFAANFRHFDQALRYLSLTVGCFQASPVFKPATHPALDPGIQQLNLELQSLTFEQLNQVWAYLGGRYLPSVVYKVRMVTVQDDVGDEVRPPVLRIDLDSETTT